MKQLQKDLTDYFRDAMHTQGIKDPGLGSIMGVLYLEPDEIPMEELAKKTGYSLSAISGKVKSLEIFGLIKTMRKPGSKKVYVYMIKNIIGHGKNILIAKQKGIISLAKQRIPSLIQEYEEKASTAKDQKGLEILKEYYAQILSFERIIGKMIKLFEEEDGKDTN